MFSGLGRVTSIVKKVVAVTFPIRTLNFQRDFSGPGKVRRLKFLEGKVRISGNLGNAFLHDLCWRYLICGKSKVLSLDNSGVSSLAVNVFAVLGLSVYKG